jgi:hypothetical protein
MRWCGSDFLVGSEGGCLLNRPCAKRQRAARVNPGGVAGRRA